MSPQRALDQSPRFPNSFKRWRIHALYAGEQLIANFSRLAPERRAHAFHCSKEIHQQGGLRSLWPLEQQRRPLLLKYALRDFSNLEFRIRLGPDALQLAFL